MPTRYYYLKLNEHFFDREEIKLIESMENGYIYSNILLKLTLLSLKDEGKLRFKDIIPYDEKMIATLTGHNLDHVRVGLKVFIDMGLVEKLSDNTMYMMDIQTLIGQSSDEADRKRIYRARIEDNRKLLVENGTNVQTYDRTKDGHSTRHIIDKDRVKDKVRDKNKDLIILIINYLNQKLKTKYRSSSNKTQSFINARLKEGFTVDDFEIVIDKKYDEWFGSDMAKYLRPETLFGSKFESYLNQPKVKKEWTPKYD